MKIVYSLILLTSLVISPAFAGLIPTSAESTYANLPLSFEANRGQTAEEVKFIARGKGYTLFLTNSEAVLSRQLDVVRMKLKNANPNPVVQGLDMLSGKSNYLTGNDSRQWHANVKQYSKVKVNQAYPGIDIVYYGNQGQLEYDFVVAPGANPKLIRMNFEGAKNIELDNHGNLVLSLTTGQLAFSAPILYQKIGNTKTTVEGQFVLARNNQVSFKVGPYDKSKELVIDPTLLYSTYLGGTGNYEDRVNAIALDSSGNIYLTGLTIASSFPGTTDHYDSSNNGGTDAFVTKISAAGTLLWSTYLGGDAIDIANAITVDGAGIVHVTGETTSTTFPKVGPQYQAGLRGGTDAFVLAIEADGTALVYSTYLGGAQEDYGYGIAVDTTGNAYVTGGTGSFADVDTGFPQTVNCYQSVSLSAPVSDAFVSKFSPAGAVAYSTFLGGSTADIGRAIAIDRIGNAYVTGQAKPGTFPIIAGAFKPTSTGPSDAFVSKISSSGANLLYSTWLGGDVDDDAFGIALEGTDPDTLKVYITGYTNSSSFPNGNDFFATVGQISNAGAPDAYVFKMNMNGGGGLLDGVYATYLGGSGEDKATSIKVDTIGNAYVTGHTLSTNFPLMNEITSDSTGGKAFVTEISSTGATKVFSTYLGGTTDQWGNGIELDSSRNVYIAGYTSSSDFPTASTTTMPSIIQSVYAGGSYDGFFTKISAPSPIPAAITNLTALTGTGARTIILNWTAPGYEGNSNNITGGQYRIRYATYVVESADYWTTGTWADYENKYEQYISTDLVTGTWENYTLTGLISMTTYYIRIWTRDGNINNWSAISNGATNYAQDQILGVSIDIDTYAFGTLQVNMSSITATVAIVTNTGNMVATWDLRAATTTAGSPWQIATTSGTDRFVLYTGLNATRPSSIDFGDEDKLTDSKQLCTASRFAIGQTGVSVPVADTRNLWVQILMPTISNVDTQQEITVYITANMP
ncbi:MAG: SBBP repeat-containing protein [Elusimicrobiota bacterium]